MKLVKSYTKLALVTPKWHLAVGNMLSCKHHREEAHFCVSAKILPEKWKFTIVTQFD